MDREMREEYLVVIQAKDMGGHMGGLSGTTTVTVTLTDINDNPPKFSKSKSLDDFNAPSVVQKNNLFNCFQEQEKKSK